MHKYFKKTLPWYHQWHESWIHGPSHWLIFACAVVTSTSLFSYVVQSAPGKAIVENIAPAAQAAAPQCANRTAISSTCSCNGVDVNNGYCCYNKVYPANQSSIVHQMTSCGYTEVSPHYPSMDAHAYGNIYFTGGSQRKNNPPGTVLPGPSIGKEYDAQAKQYDTIFNQDPAGYVQMKRTNPTIKFTAYTTYNELDCVLETHTYCEKYDYIQQRAQADGVKFEDLFLHFAKNYTITASGQTRNFLGWNPLDDQGQCGGVANDGTNDVIASCHQAASNPNASAPTRFMARMPYGYREYWRNTSSSPYYPQDWRWRVNSKNTNYQQYNSDYTKKMIADLAAAGTPYDGIFVDNMGRNPYGSGNDAELENGNSLEVTSTTDWYSGIAATLLKAKQDLNAIGKTLNINAGVVEYWYNGFAGNADGYVREWFISALTNATTESRIVNLATPQTTTVKNLGQRYYANFTLNASWDYGNAGQCWEGYTMQKEQVWSLATYYLLKFPGLDFFPGYKTWSGYWFGAMATDIGTPVGDYFVWKSSLVDSSGQTYKIYRRNFTKGVVFARHWAGPEGSCPGATKISASSSVPLDAADLAKEFRVVNVDGTLGGKPTTVNLATANGLILQDVAAAGVPASDITPPAKVDNLTAL